MLRPVMMVLLAILTLSAAQVGGTWSGMLEQKAENGRTGHMWIFLQLKQDSDRISGTAGPTESNQAPIHDARLEGPHLGFSVTLPAPPGSDAGPTWKFELTVSGDRMKGKGEGTMGKRSLGVAEVFLTRQK